MMGTSHTRPAERRPGRVGLTASNTRAIWRNQTQLQSRSELIVKCHHISSQSHAYTDKDSEAVGVTDF